jgi:hypothetical protein
LISSAIPTINRIRPPKRIVKKIFISIISRNSFLKRVKVTKKEKIEPRYIDIPPSRGTGFL